MRDCSINTGKRDTREVSYRFGNDLNLSSVIGLFKDSGISRPVEDSERIKEMFRLANLVVTAWDGDILVGKGRALADFSYCCYLSGLAVKAEYQRLGIGEKIISLMSGKLGDRVAMVLLSAPEAMTYYPKIGFVAAKTGWRSVASSSPQRDDGLPTMQFAKH